MTNLLSTYKNSRENNFNLIRFIAASLVLFSHSFALALGSPDFEPMRSTIGMTWGDIAVDIFFITSGFLITSSYLSNKGLFAFVWARALRIYPALIVAIIFCVSIGAWFTVLSTQEYFSSLQTYKYIIKNAILFFNIEYTLPGVFLNVPAPSAVNGSLWTLPHEVKMYALLTIILGFTAYISRWLKFITIRNITLLVGIFSMGFHIFNHFYEVLTTPFIRLFAMFFVGAAFYTWGDKVRLSSKWFAFGLPLLLASSFNKDLFFIFYCLSLPILVLYLAYVPSGRIRKFNKIGDYSYGIYIYAFPVQQSLAAIVPNISVAEMVIFSFLVTLFLSVLSWHLIEKKCLKLKGKYLLIENFVRNFGLTTNRSS